MNSKLTIGCLAALFITGAMHPAQASAEEIVTRQIPVEFKRSDLGSEHGARQLLERLRNASRRACSYDGPSLTAGRNYRACVDTAQAEAVEKVNAPMLTAMFQGQRAIQLARR